MTEDKMMRVSQETKARLDKFKIDDESYDSAISALLDGYENGSISRQIVWTDE